MKARLPDHDRYLRLVHWARDRYARNGRLPISRGNSPLAFARVERAAAKRYLGML